MTLNPILFTVFLSALLLSCSNNDDEERPATIEAKINGELVIFETPWEKVQFILTQIPI